MSFDPSIVLPDNDPYAAGIVGFHANQLVKCTLKNGSHKTFNGHLCTYLTHTIRPSISCYDFGDQFLIDLDSGNILFETPRLGFMDEYLSGPLERIAPEQQAYGHRLVTLHVFHTRGYGDPFGKWLLNRPLTDDVLLARVQCLFNKTMGGNHITKKTLKRRERKKKDQRLTYEHQSRDKLLDILNL